MLRFYWSLIREIPAVFRGSVEGWMFWILSIGAPAVVLFNPQLQQWTNTPQFSRWFVLVPIGLSVVYGMLRVNFERFEAVSAERDGALRQLEHRGTPITREDWMAMSNEFRVLDNGYPSVLWAREIYAMWQDVGGTESWFLSGDTEPRRQLAALCRRAGAMLLASPRVRARLSPKVRAYENDPVSRWLQLLREQPDVRPSMTGTGRHEGTPTKSETIDGLPGLSVAVCVNCSTEEI